ncbi:hypothetical protein NC652_017653 [Populus alba x Populus x berolinensis]|nr:hypothetical protein NC652_017653 [Populus alba x Populus x berolinensis]
MFGRLTSFQLWRICFCIRFNGTLILCRKGRSRTTGTQLALLLALGTIPKLFKPGRKCT